MCKISSGALAFSSVLVQVVRRRAVPREVGPPPGGPTLVHTQIPVVFFTQSGVPGEVTDVLASSQGPVDVCTQAMAHIGQHNAQSCHDSPHTACSQRLQVSTNTVAQGMLLLHIKLLGDIYKIGFVACIIMGCWRQPLAECFLHKQLVMQPQE